MERLPYVKIQTECPITKLGPVSIYIEYLITKDGIAFGRAQRCSDSKDGNTTCHKCIAYFTEYVTYNPIPKDGDFIPANLDYLLKWNKSYPVYKQET